MRKSDRESGRGVDTPWIHLWYKNRSSGGGGDQSIPPLPFRPDVCTPHYTERWRYRWKKKRRRRKFFKKINKRYQQEHWSAGCFHPERFFFSPSCPSLIIQVDTFPPSSRLSGNCQSGQLTPSIVTFYFLKNKIKLCGLSIRPEMETSAADIIFFFFCF